MNGTTWDNDNITLTVAVMRQNIDHLIEAADRETNTRTDTVNRSLAFYNTVTKAKPGATLSWQDSDGTRHTLLVLR